MESSSEQSLSEFVRQSLDPTVCFLCGGELGDNSTAEHVVPRWLQRRHDLWNKQLTLPNGTYITYSNLRIPACESCNSGYLGPIEDAVSRAFATGAGAVRALPKDTIFIWLAKVYYGLLIRDMTLLMDQTDPTSRSVVDQEHLEAFALLHLTLRRAIGEVQWNVHPATIYVFETLPPVAGDDFDLFDSFEAPIIAVRSGTVFVVGFLEDFGAIANLRLEETDYLAAAASLKLHPLQCTELTGYFLAWALHRRTAPKLLVGRRGDGYELVAFPPGGLSGRSPFPPMEGAFMAKVLDDMFDKSRNMKIQGKAGEVPTLILGPSGDPVQAPDAATGLIDWGAGFAPGT